LSSVRDVPISSHVSEGGVIPVVGVWGKVWVLRFVISGDLMTGAGLGNEVAVEFLVSQGKFVASEALILGAIIEIMSRC
jgi:hypothetical protein